MRRTAPTLKAHEVEDLVQQAYELAIRRITRFEGRSSLKTWFVSLARNLFIDMSRRAAIRPNPAGDLVSERPTTARPEVEDLRERTLDLHAWLRSPEGREAIPRGAEVLTLLVNTGGDYEKSALDMTTWTGRRWDVGRLRGTVRVIKTTLKGQALCQAIGVDPDRYEED